MKSPDTKNVTDEILKKISQNDVTPVNLLLTNMYFSKILHQLKQILHGVRGAKMIAKKL